MNINYSLKGVDEQGRVVVELSVTRQHAASIALDVLIEQGQELMLDTGHISSENMQTLVENLNKQINKNGNKMLDSIVNVKKKKGRPSSGIDEKIEQARPMIASGMSYAKVAKQLGVGLANLYARIPRGAKPKKITPTPEKVGEREIDKEPPIIGEIHWTDIKESHDDGMSINVIKLSYPSYEMRQLLSAVTFDTYEEYRSSLTA